MNSLIKNRGAILSFVFIGLLSSILFLIPTTSEAQGFIPCTGVDCNICHIVVLGNTIIGYLIGLIFVIFAVMLFIAGFGLVMSGGNKTKLDEAKKKLTNALIGMLIVFSAWLVIDTLLKATLGDSTTGTLSGGQVVVDSSAQGANRFGPWNSISCAGGQNSPSSPVGNGQQPLACDAASLQAQYNGSPVGVDAPGLQAMISCYRNDATVASLLSSQPIYTHELSEPLCAVTNGTDVAACGINCAHSAGSCHYGAGTGQGAMAADFNAADGSISGEDALYNALINMRATCGGSFIKHTSHTHISIQACPGT